MIRKQLLRWTFPLVFLLVTGCPAETPAPGLSFPEDGGWLPPTDAGDATGDATGPGVDGLTPSDGGGPLDSVDPLDDVDPADGLVPADSLVPMDGIEPADGTEPLSDSTDPEVTSPADVEQDDCPPPPIDSDGDGVPDDEDCAPLDVFVYPGAPETCNGNDDDCDEEIDEDIEDLVCGEGVCQSTVPACAFGVPITCVPKDIAGDETCDTLDNDCDGETDEGFEVLTCGIGACTNSIYSCQEGVETTCEPLEPGEEICDGLDNDCDEETDEELVEISCGDGVCATSVPGCIEGEVPECEPLDMEVDEVCDGLDNDCNGEVDEELGETTCGEGPCQTTVANCLAGVPQDCVPPISVGTCDAPPAYCNQTTTGTDACGLPCSKIGPPKCFVVHPACLTSNPGAYTDATHCTTPKGNYNCGLTCQQWPNTIGADCTYCTNIFCQPASGLDKSQFYCSNYPAPPTE